MCPGKTLYVLFYIDTTYSIGCYKNCVHGKLLFNFLPNHIYKHYVAISCDYIIKLVQKYIRLGQTNVIS